MSQRFDVILKGGTVVNQDGEGGGRHGRERRRQGGALAFFVAKRDAVLQRAQPDDVAVAHFPPASREMVITDKRPEATPRAVRAPIMEHGAASIEQLDLGVVAAHGSR